ncbi:family 43 glycosylhydrolase [Streptomyces sp. NPDC005438]|uniref:family 43 glycosylhydrolase n=1 Tax=Streptomyces sp. NPDC005438 TaxID=3156880 RepID=UPI0033A70265
MDEGSSRRGSGRKRVLTRRHGAVVVAAVTALAIGAGINAANGSAVPSSPGGKPGGKGKDGQALSTRAEESSFPLADPDTVRAKNGKYVTYGTTVPAGRGKRCDGAKGKLNVPVMVHGSGNSVGMTNCASDDALPGGPGKWASSTSSIWAPGVVHFGGQYLMFYTASRKGTKQKCIGRAVSSTTRGPFRSVGVWACPPAGRWAIDANPFVSGKSLYVTYRDDAIASGAETGISTVRTDKKGRAVWKTRRDVLKSTDIKWDSKKNPGRPHIVENPAMWRASNGRWYLMFSGNRWDSPRYSTGIATCGKSPLPASRCKPARQGAKRPYFGFTGSTGLNPYRGLPKNHKGAAGIDVFTAADGSHRVVWHWWDGKLRRPMTGVLKRTSSGYKIS